MLSKLKIEFSLLYLKEIISFPSEFIKLITAVSLFKLSILIVKYFEVGFGKQFTEKLLV